MKRIFAGILLLGLSLNLRAQKKLVPFKANDRVVFAGNSITEAGLYESYIWLYYMTHFPERRLEIFNAGIGGDVAKQIFDRLDGDILKKNPTTLVLTFGMNDSKYFEYLDQNKPVDDQKRSEIIKESFDSYAKIENRLKNLPELEKVIMASSPYDETAKLEGNNFVGKAKTMEGIIDFQKKSAKQNHWGYIDLFHPMTDINVREQNKNPAYTNTGADRIHPGSAGHFIMAYLFLKAQGLSDLPIADFAIDVQQGKTIKAINASVTNINKMKNGLAFDYLAKSLPYPMDTAARVWQNAQVQTEALDVIPFTEEFNQEKMVLSGLRANIYQLKIDGHVIGKWTAEELKKGLNLATIKNTPQYQQALKLLALNNERRGVEGKFRNYYWVQYNFLKEKGMLFNDGKAARDTIANHISKNGWLGAKKGDYDEVVDKGGEVKSKMERLINEIYTVNKPQKHHFEITAVN